MSIIQDFYIPNQERKTSRKEFEKFFDKESSKVIEDGLFNYTEQYCRTNIFYKTISLGIYKDNKTNLLFNLEKNGQTIKKIKKGIEDNTFNPYNLAFLRPEELDGDKWMKIILRMNTTEDKIKNLPTVEWKACFRCKGTEYSKYQLQTRSIDEPATTFYVCKQCGKSYSINI